MWVTGLSPSARAVDTAASGAPCTPDVVPTAANHAVLTRGEEAEIQEQPLGAAAPAHASGGMVRGDSSLKREISQLKHKEEEARMQAEVARKDAEIAPIQERAHIDDEIERARMDAEIERVRKDAEMDRKEAENKRLLMQLEIERSKNQREPQAAAATGEEVENHVHSLGVAAPAHASGEMVRGDSSLKREISQLKHKEQEARMQAEVARKDAEIERASKEEENKQLLMQLEIERLRNQQQMPQPPSACCSVS